MAFTTRGDVFGGCFRVAVTKQCGWFDDPNLFIFSFESRGRCVTPQNFDVDEYNKDRSAVRFYKDEAEGYFVAFICGYGDSGGFYLGNEKSSTFCDNVSFGFAGIGDTTLTGMNYVNFTCYRLVAIPLE